VIPSSAEVEERVRVIPVLLQWAFMACCRVNFNFTISNKKERNNEVHFSVLLDSLTL
jgi:hypothetical protein